MKTLFEIPVDLIEVLGWTLIHSLWQAALIALILLFLRYRLRKFSAEGHYRLALGGIMLSLMLLLGTGAYLWMEKVEEQEMAVIASDSLVIIQQQAMEIGQTLILIDRGGIEQGIDPILNYLVAGWLLGILFFSIRFLGGWWYLKRLVFRASQPVSRHWQEKLEDLIHRIDLRRSVRLRISDQVDEPLTFGWLKPVILVPTGMLSGLTPDQVEAILYHELAHILRDDYLINLFQSLVEILMFYHPAIWWMSRIAREEREHAADDLALRVFRNPQTYARALIRVKSRDFNPAIQTALYATGKRSLTHRIQRLFGMKSHTENRKKTAGILSLLVLISLLIGFVQYQQPLQAQEAPEPSFPAAAVTEAPEVPQAPETAVPDAPQTIAEFPAPAPVSQPAVPSPPAFPESESAVPDPHPVPTPEPSWTYMGEPVSIEINGKMKSDDLIRLVQRLDDKGIRLMIDELKTDAKGRIELIEGRVKFPGGQSGSFSTTHLDQIKINLSEEGEMDIRVKSKEGKNKNQNKNQDQGNGMLFQPMVSDWSYSLADPFFQDLPEVAPLFRVDSPDKKITIISGDGKISTLSISGDGENLLKIKGNDVVVLNSGEIKTYGGSGLSILSTEEGDTNQVLILGDQMDLFADGEQDYFPLIVNKDGKSVMISGYDGSRDTQFKILNDVKSEGMEINDNEIILFHPPFKEEPTEIKFTLEKSQKVSIKVFDSEGNLIETLVDEKLKKGKHKYSWEPPAGSSEYYRVIMKTPKKD